jgi:hypothetical protein
LIADVLWLYVVSNTIPNQGPIQRILIHRVWAFLPSNVMMHIFWNKKVERPCLPLWS